MNCVLIKESGSEKLLRRMALVTFPLIISGCHKELPERPNILIAIGDDISFPHMSAYGCTFVNSPGFDRVAGQGILFMNAYTPNAKSAPSRACLITGRNSWQLEEAGNHVPYFPLKYRSFIEVLGENGYFTGFTAKGWAPGVALDSAGKGRQLTGKPFNRFKTSPPSTGISANDYAANFDDFLASRDKDKPFFFWYGSTEPHRRYEYGSGVTKGGKKLDDITDVFGFWPDCDTVRNDLLDYAFEIEYFDAQLVKMISRLEAAGELDNTIIIVTADNGMPFPRVKGNAYEYSNHMPLAIMWGRGIKDPGRVINDYVSFIDIAPTLLEAAGISNTEAAMSEIEGKSFADIFRSGKSGVVNKAHDHAIIGQERHDVGRPGDAGYPVRGIVKGGYLYLRNFKPDRWPAGNPETGYLNTDGSPTKTLILRNNRRGISHDLWLLNFGKRVESELYDISADPECLHNLAVDQKYEIIRQGLDSQLLSELKEQGDPRMAGNGDVFDDYPYAEERIRGFYEKYLKGEVWRKDAGWVDSTDFESSKDFH